MINIEHLIGEVVKLRVELQGLNHQTLAVVAEMERNKPIKSMPLSVFEAHEYWVHMNKYIDHAQKIKSCEA